MRYRLSRAIGFLVCLLVWIAVYPVPAAEAGGLFGISTSQEISLGRDVAKQLEKQYGLVDDPALQARVAAIGAKLVAVSDRKDLPYSFKVLNSKEINALALPGGFIYIFKGLTDYMPSDDELAGVLGHELGHVVKRHSVHQMEKSMGMSTLFAVVFGDRGVPLQSLAYQAIMSGYSRSDESEADQMGFVHSFKAGYNPYSMLIGLSRLEDLDNKGSYGWFSSHPDPEARVNQIKDYMAKQKISPQVIDAGRNTAQVVEGEWRMPPIYAQVDGYKPLYRAYFAAGILYRLEQLPDLSPDKFILDTDGSKVTIYYDDTLVMTVAPEDAAAAGMSLMDLAGTYQSSLRDWACARLNTKQ